MFPNRSWPLDHYFTDLHVLPSIAKPADLLALVFSIWTPAARTWGHHIWSRSRVGPGLQSVDFSEMNRVNLANIIKSNNQSDLGVYGVIGICGWYQLKPITWHVQLELGKNLIFPYLKHLGFSLLGVLPFAAAGHEVPAKHRMPSDVHVLPWWHSDSVWYQSFSCCIFQYNHQVPNISQEFSLHIFSMFPLMMFHVMMQPLKDICVFPASTSKDFILAVLLMAYVSHSHIQEAWGGLALVGCQTWQTGMSNHFSIPEGPAVHRVLCRES